MSTHNAVVTNGIFQRVDIYAYARAADVMTTKSAIGFEWTVKLIGQSSFIVGITSQLKPNTNVLKTDPNSILYGSDDGSTLIYGSSKILYPNLQKQETGEIVHFKFQPQRKKLVIELVRH